ncbi:Nucleolar protein 13 [Candida viswanathii]|uniref:Nucleolar protein 13 n=1 Tax=Candida viswanathii TaxID=5486 RepID=A0A367XVA6_9ASCO|nr:Nucleolar protein 13 [Candida viswanathii]
MSDIEEQPVVDATPDAVEEPPKKEKKSKKSKKDKKEKKRKHHDSDEEELEIDLNAQIPLSKKQQRQLKKGKLDLAKLSKKHPAPKPENAPEEPESESTSKRSPFGVWIGNLSFDTTKEDLIRFITHKAGSVDEADISRVNIPKKGTQIKGFAYVDLPSLDHVNDVVGLSEQILNGRKLLIKNATSFEGRPEKAPEDLAAASKNPPSRILFVGNLSFDTTEDNLEEHFRHCGDITRIRMATFQDTGKCKGFAFIDFKNEEGATNALKSKLTKSLINRKLRMEYGEDRSAKRPKRLNESRGDSSSGEFVTEGYEQRESKQRESKPRATKLFDGNDGGESRKRQYREREPAQSNKRMKSSVALASAQRASAAIVPSAGKKTKFD